MIYLLDENDEIINAVSARELNSKKTFRISRTPKTNRFDFN